MATGDSNDFISRLKRTIPPRWFKTEAPNRDAIFGGISDALACIYDLNAFVKLQERLATATGQFIDLFSFDYLALTVRRLTGELDSDYAARVKRELIRERVTRAGMDQVIFDFAGSHPIIIEPWNPNDTGAWDQPRTAWDIGGARWGDTDHYTPGASIIFPPEVVAGPPGIPGWDISRAAWDTGTTAFFDAPQNESYEAEAYGIINETKPLGTPVWVQFATAA